jgi:hypothetical protein
MEHLVDPTAEYALEEVAALSERYPRISTRGATHDRCRSSVSELLHNHRLNAESWDVETTPQHIDT